MRLRRQPQEGVLQEWVTRLPLMMQGTLMTSMRGNDLHACPKIKVIVRWLRAHTLNNGNPENDFMDLHRLPSVEEMHDELEYVTVHYLAHLLHTLEIVGYKHPAGNTAQIALNYYLRIVHWLHLSPETEEHLDERLSGRPGTTGAVQPWAPEAAVGEIEVHNWFRGGIS